MGDLYPDHKEVVESLLGLCEAIQARGLLRIKSTLEWANFLAGPYFKFEERHLYPVLKEFIGEAGLQHLLVEYDGVFRGVDALLQIAQKSAWG